MNDFERISGIQKSTNDEQLDNAMAGYRLDAVTAYPVLQLNRDFNDALEAGQYMRALESVRRVRHNDGNEYSSVIRVLEFAAERRLAIMMKNASGGKTA